MNLYWDLAKIRVWWWCEPRLYVACDSFLLQEEEKEFFFHFSIARSFTERMTLLLTSLPNDCLTSIAELVPTRYWPQLRATCRELRAAVREATTGLLIDIRSLPYSEGDGATFCSSSSFSCCSPRSYSPLLPSDRLLLSRVREVRIILHKERDESALSTEGLGRAEACPVAPLLSAISRARSAAGAGPPPRVSLCLRAPRAAIVLDVVLEWLSRAGILRVDDFDLRADDAETHYRDTHLPVLWGELSAARCRLRVEMKYRALRDRGALLSLLSGAPLASLSVLAIAGSPAMSAAEAAAVTERGFRRVRAFAETLEELQLGETIPVGAVRATLTGEEGSKPPRWPKLRKVVLRGSAEEGEEEEGGGSGSGNNSGPFFPRPASTSTSEE